MSSEKYQSTIATMKIEVAKAIEKENICGLAIALVDKQGIIWSKGFGYTDINKEKEVTADTLFSTQSMGKTTTATAFMILASKGLIGLDEPIRKYYPDFSVKTKYGEPEAEIKKITFRKLLGHIAGLTHEAPIGGNYNYTQCTFEEHIASIKETWLRSKVGTEFAYSNLGFDLVAYVLGKITDKSFPVVVHEELFKPLGIKNATMDINEAKKYSFAKGHIGDYQTPAVQIPMLGAGGVYISVNEQAKFLMLHLNKGKVNNNQLIEPELFNEMYSTPFITTKRAILFGLGLYQEQPIGEAEVWAHGGGGYGYLTYNAWMPEQGIGAIVFTNGMHHSGQNVKLVRKALELMIEESKQPESVVITEAKLQRLIGTYYTIRTPIHNVQLENGKLIVYSTRGKKETFYPQGELKFLTKEGNKAVFELDDKQQVVGYEYTTKNNFQFLSYNDGPNDPSGTLEEKWNNCLGIYELFHCGLKYYLGIAEFNGYLYLFSDERWRLKHHKENIFFTADGESVIFNEEKVSYRNIPLKKTNLAVNELLEDCKKSEEKQTAYIDIFKSVIGVLYWSKGFDTAFSFAEEIIEINDKYHKVLSDFATLVYGYRELKQAKKCYNRLLSFEECYTTALKELKKIDLELAKLEED